MGKIHDALRKAEEERATLAGPAAAAEGGAARRESAQAPRERQRQLRDARRAQVMLNNMAPMATEEFRTLRQRIQSLRRSREIRSLVVTSACAGEGKTTTATNLALCFGLEPDTRTCLVDADLRRPAVHGSLPVVSDAGLAELLETDAKLDEVLVQIPDTLLWALPVRGLPERPSELLASRRMVDLMKELTERFDTVIVDAPPVLGLPDAGALIDLCDATLFVVAAARTPRGQVSAALERIDRRKLIGSVFNRCDERSTPYGYGGGER